VTPSLVAVDLSIWYGSALLQCLILPYHTSSVSSALSPSYSSGSYGLHSEFIAIATLSHIVYWDHCLLGSSEGIPALPVQYSPPRLCQLLRGHSRPYGTNRRKYNPTRAIQNVTLEGMIIAQLLKRTMLTTSKDVSSRQTLSSCLQTARQSRLKLTYSPEQQRKQL
jgi:hypothetical protein